MFSEKRVCILVVLVMILVMGLVFTSSEVQAAKKMTLTLWDWHNPRMVLFQDMVKKYEKVNPNIKFETLIMPWGDFWQKSLAGAAAGRVPDVTQFHNAKTSIFIDLLEPFPEDIYPLGEMREKYWNFDTGFLLGGKFYFYPAGVMTSHIYYNKQLWEEGGLSESDIPETWDDLRNAAKKLTKYTSQNEIDISGFDIKGGLQHLWNDFHYQQGGWMYTADGRGAEWDTPGGLKALSFIADLIFKDKVVSPGFLPFMEGFGTEKAAMVYSWGWFGGWMDQTYPDVKYFTSMIPTLTGGDRPARARNNYECGVAVYQSVPDDKKREAFKFIKWMYDDADFSVKLNIALKRVPADLSLWNDPRITEEPTIKTAVKQIPYTIFPGEYVAPIDQALVRMAERIMDGMPAAEALTISNRECSEELKDKPPTWLVH